MLDWMRLTEIGWHLKVEKHNASNVCGKVILTSTMLSRKYLTFPLLALAKDSPLLMASTAAWAVVASFWFI